MFIIIDTLNTTPLNCQIDKKLNVLPGQIASLAIKEDHPTIIISDGVVPFGIIDDIRSDKTRCVSIDEKIYISVSNDKWEISDDGEATNKTKIIYNLNNPSIISQSYKCSGPAELFSCKQGTIVVPAKTKIKLEKDDDNSYVPYICFKTSYAFNVPLISFDDSISSTGRVIIWSRPLIVKTDMFDTSCSYHINESLYVTNGLVTWKQNTEYSKKIGRILKTPSNKDPFLTFLWDPENEHPEIISILEKYINLKTRTVEL